MPKWRRIDVTITPFRRHVSAGLSAIHISKLIMPFKLFFFSSDMSKFRRKSCWIKTACQLKMGKALQIGLSKQCKPRSDCSLGAVWTGPTLIARPTTSFGWITAFKNRPVPFLDNYGIHGPHTAKFIRRFYGKITCNQLPVHFPLFFTGARKHFQQSDTER